MSDERDDGGPAFPHRWTAVDGAPMGVRGMSLRDYFAGQVLPSVFESANRSNRELATTDKVAEKAYQIADAMLKAKEEA